MERAVTAKWVKHEAGYGLLAESEGRRLFYSPSPVTLLYARNGKFTRESFPAQWVAGNSGLLSCTDALGNEWHGEVSLCVQPDGGVSGSLRMTLVKGAAEGVFAGLTLKPQMPLADTYICFPGYVYDGNNWDDRVKEIPRLCAAQENKFFIPIFGMAMPVGGFVNRSTGVAAYFATEQNVGGYDVGYLCDCGGGEIEVTATVPLYREWQAKLAPYDGTWRWGFQHNPPEGAVLAQGGSLSLPFHLTGGDCPGVPGLFDDLLSLRALWRQPHTPKLPLSEARALVEENFNTRHWIEDLFYAGATQMDGTPSPDLGIGWCSGFVTCYALLASPDPQTRARAVKMTDFICDTGLSPSGFFHPRYQDGVWMEEPVLEPRADKGIFLHIRMLEDAIFYLLLAYNDERARGVEHANWCTALLSNLDALCVLYENHGEFGLYISRQEAKVLEGNVAAGGLCIACLAHGYRLFGDERYLRVAEAAGESYYQKFLGRGRVGAGPLDILCAADSESACMYPESYVTLYEITGEPVWLRYACDAANHFASWALCFNGVYPKGSLLDRLAVESTGNVIANVQNHHNGPGAATHSMAALLRIYRHTGDTRYLRLLEDIAGTLPQWVSQYDGHISPLKRGMVTEQFDLSDEMNYPRGDIWDVSVCWGATVVLLTQRDVPGVYVDVENEEMAVFDHVKAEVCWCEGAVSLENPTAFPMRLIFAREKDGDLDKTLLHLAPGEKLDIPLR